jgi:hypothetical protein
MVVLLSIVCILIGALLGLRFRVPVFVPATAICIFLVLLIGLYSGATRTVIVAVISAALLQVGYLGGVTMSFFVADAPGDGVRGLFSGSARRERLNVARYRRQLVRER